MCHVRREIGFTMRSNDSSRELRGLRCEIVSLLIQVGPSELESFNWNCDPPDTETLATALLSGFQPLPDTDITVYSRKFSRLFRNPKELDPQTH